MTHPILKYKTIFISDVHLGIPDCKIEQVTDFLVHTQCEKLVLNGDIIDGWHIRRRGGWSKAHTHFFRLILRKVEKEDTEVVYLRGNHDDFLWRILPFGFDKVIIDNEHIHETPHGRYICVHGDAFDAVTTNHKWLAVAGGFGYSALLWLNRSYNRFRRLRGKPYFSLSKFIKAKVKSAVNFVGRYEEQLQRFAADRDCQGIICGHIHTPADKQIGDIRYLNSGDWVESMTAIVETMGREMELVTYEGFRSEIDRLGAERPSKFARPGRPAFPDAGAEPSGRPPVRR